jgi:hypothetical protein
MTFAPQKDGNYTIQIQSLVGSTQKRLLTCKKYYKLSAINCSLPFFYFHSDLFQLLKQIIRSTFRCLTRNYCRRISLNSRLFCCRLKNISTSSELKPIHGTPTVKTPESAPSPEYACLPVCLRTRFTYCTPTFPFFYGKSQNS